MRVKFCIDNLKKIPLFISDHSCGVHVLLCVHPLMLLMLQHFHKKWMKKKYVMFIFRSTFQLCLFPGKCSLWRGRKLDASLPRSIAEISRLRTSDRAVGRPLRYDVAPLIEKDVGAPGAHFFLRHQVHAAVVVAVPLSVHWVPAVRWNAKPPELHIVHNRVSSCSSHCTHTLLAWWDWRQWRKILHARKHSVTQQ